MADTFKGIITADGKKRQLPYGSILDKPVSDETLSIQGGFADAKTVGNKFAKVNETTDSLKEDIINGNVATNVTMPINRYDKNSATVGGYISDGGSIEENSQFSYSDYIDIDKTKKYAVWSIFGINITGALYDKNKQFLGLIYKSSISNGVIDFSSFSNKSYYNSIALVRLNQTVNDMNGSMFVEDATEYPSEYIPYTKPAYEVVGNLSKAINELLESYGLEKGYILINEALSNIAIGKSAMKNATTDNGEFNVAIGDNALMNNTGTGSDDTGNYNVAVGYRAMEQNTTGNHNTAVGFQSMPANTTGTGNTALGEDACLGNTTGNGNTGVGRYSLFSNKEGSDNVAVGLHSLRNCLGNRNTAIGQSSGVSCKGNNNIFLGYYSNANENVENSIVLGPENYCHESNMMDVGSSFIEKVVLSTKTGKKLILFNTDGTVTWSKYTPPSN